MKKHFLFLLLLFGIKSLSAREVIFKNDTGIRFNLVVRQSRIPRSYFVPPDYQVKVSTRGFCISRFLVRGGRITPFSWSRRRKILPLCDGVVTVRIVKTAQGKKFIASIKRAE